MQHRVGLSHQQRQKAIQQQQLSLSPQLRQNIKLLELQVADLIVELDKKVENPALEIVKEKELISIDQLATEERFGVPDYFENSSDPGRVNSLKVSSHYDTVSSDNRQRFLEGALSREETLQEHLLWQLGVQPLSEDQNKLGELIIENLDEHGFISPASLEWLSGREQGRDLPDLLEMIQQFDPPGTAVTDYKESLKVQADLRGDAPEQLEEVIDESLELLARKRFDEVARLHGCDKEEAEEIFRYLSLLNPYPGLLFTKEKPDYVIPDLCIQTGEEGLVVRVNNDDVPVLKITADFEEMSDGDGQEKAVRQFARQLVDDARGVIEAVEMRQRTLERVGLELVRVQPEFFIRGKKGLKPLLQKEVAQSLNLSESTISRIAKEKHIQTDWGIFPVKIFFSQAVEGGKGVAATGIKEMIREIIENHSSEKRLSDQKICNMLLEQGIDVKRRTVNKYRNELNIASSFDRGGL